MTKEETIMVLGYIKSSYPRWAENLNSSDARMMVEVWHDAFADFDSDIVLGAAKAHRNAEKWPPSIAEIMEKINLIQHGTSNELTGMQAWNLVRKAIKNGIYNSKTEFCYLPPEVQSAIGSHHALKDWAQMEQSELETVIQSQFIKSFAVKQKQATEMEMLPNDVKTMIAESCDKLRQIE